MARLRGQADQGRALSGRLGPRSIERVTDGGATEVAVLDQADPFLVDGGGLIQPSRAGWTLDWWIGADDRWYTPSREPSIRQRRRGAGPVLDTSMRVPSGDVTQTVYATAVGGRPVVVMEVANGSPVPVALALALRPFDLEGRLSSLSLGWVSGRELEIDRWRLSLPRRPNEAGLGLHQDLWSAVTAGEKLVWPDQVPDEAGIGTDEGGFINGLLMYPLPHGTTLRVCLGPAGHSIDLDAIPEADNVANGWNTVVERGGRFEFPDPGITALASAARARLLLAEPDLGHRLADGLKDGSGSLRRLLTRLRPRTASSAASDRERAGGTELAEIETMVALAESGHLDRPARWLPIVAQALLVDPVDDRPPKLAGLVEAVARTAVLLEDADSAELVVEPLARLTKRLESAGPASTGAWVKAATGLLALVDHLGQTEAACDLRSRLDQSGEDGPGASNGHDLQLVTELVERAHPAGRWTVDGDPRPDSLMEAARFWRAARGRLFRERLDVNEPTIELLPGFAASWRGGSVEVHDAATLYGPLSFAIRWHGARPALLWDQGDGRTSLICPALDPGWRSRDSRGETLLAGASGGLADVPAPGDSFI